MFFFVNECVVENVYVFFFRDEFAFSFLFRQHFFQKMSLYGGNVYVTFGKWVCLFSENRNVFRKRECFQKMGMFFFSKISKSK